MAANKRTAIQIERDRREIARLYLRGWKQAEIAERLSGSEDREYALSQQMISYDIKRLIEQWRASALLDLDQAKAEELAKVNQLEVEYWEAWENSKATLKRQRGQKKVDGQLTEQTISVNERDGDPRFLTGVQWCIERRCKILGLDAPSKHDLTSGGEKFADATDEGRLVGLMALYDRIAKAAIPEPGGAESDLDPADTGSG